MNERWRDYTRLAWEISPVLAVYLPVRLKKTDSIVKEVCRLVRLKPIPVMHVPEAMQYLVTTESLLNDAPEVAEKSNQEISFYKTKRKLAVTYFYFYL